ncbi:MAG: hypothetical protein JW784_05215 [Candidatus Cloacimonetes bacterium]|nr:hypothetical protein [Candidatus Cloacimonadota bacterium]
MNLSYAYVEKNKWHLVEIATVLLMGISKIVVGDLLNSKFYFIITGLILVILFITLRGILKPSLLSQWGFTRMNFFSSLTVVGPATIISITSFIFYGLIRGNPLINTNFFIVLILYPFWGVIQQYLIAVLMAGNLNRITRGVMTRTTIVISVAFFFALIHFPELPLVVASFFLGIITVSSFLRFGNIWTIGIFHGWFATFLYYFVLNNDPLMDIMIYF